MYPLANQAPCAIAAAGANTLTYLSTVVLRISTTLQTAAAMSAVVLVCDEDNQATSCYALPLCASG